MFALVYGLLIGIGCSATFVPLLADVSHWFDRRRGIAVAICASGNYIAGTIWPPVVEHFIGTAGWRADAFRHRRFSASCTMLPLALLLRRRPPVHAGHVTAAARPRVGTLGLRPSVLQGMLAVAGVCCCVAMSMPQVHLVAYCGDLGYGAERGAQMLSLMLGLGIVSRIISGFVADRIGGLATLLFGSLAQMTALSLYLMLDGLDIAVRDLRRCSACSRAGWCRVTRSSCANASRRRRRARELGVVMMATLFGMALGGWMSGAIFDLTGSYQAAFANGVAWNFANAMIAVWLLLRAVRRTPLRVVRESGA